MVLSAVGNLYNRLGDPESARDCLERALAIGERTLHRQLQVGCLVDLSEIHGAPHEWDEALYRARGRGRKRPSRPRDGVSVRPPAALLPC